MHADADSKIRRFGSTRTEWGFNKFMNFQTLTHDSKRYIQDDACIFGAEVFVIKQSGLMEDVNPYTWKGWGFPAFFPLLDLIDSSKGFLVNDTIILEVEFTNVSLIKT
ncbi:hypothetical protein LguiA_026010 [Lonicera macranthoides]